MMISSAYASSYLLFGAAHFIIIIIIHSDHASAAASAQPPPLENGMKHDNHNDDNNHHQNQFTRNNNNNNNDDDGRRRRRRRNLLKKNTKRVAPLNTYLLVKDEFDERRREIEDFVFQTLDAFSTTTGSNGGDNGGSNGGGNNNGAGTATATTSPSKLYTYDAFFRSLRTMAVDGVLGQSYQKDTNSYVPGYDGADNAYAESEDNAAFYLSQDDDDDDDDDDSSSGGNAMGYAIVNVCAFLANAMAEAIQFDACEEFNGMVYGGLNTGTGTGTAGSGGGMLSELAGVNGRYFPMSNACGQFGKSYQGDDDDEGECPADYNEGGDDTNASCPVDADLEVTAALHPKYNYNQDKQTTANNDNDIIISGDQPPPPFRCAPETRSGYWDGYDVEFVRRVAYPSLLGKTSVEGCCFWGRGALMTRGTCGLGRLNRRMGAGAYGDGRPARYPAVDFCRNPSIICGVGDKKSNLNGALYSELKFVVALFDWVDRVQTYENEGSRWGYLEQLKLFADGGMKDADGDGDGDADRFIDAVSSVLTRGCDGYYCSTRTIHFMEQRRRNFKTLIYDIFNLGGTWDSVPKRPKTPAYDFDHAMRWLHNKRSKIEGNILVSKNNALGGVSYFSQEYQFEPLLTALRTTAYYGVGDQRYFILSNEKEGLRGFNAGLVNLAFFLANAMAESISNDSCDEIHWEKVGGRYAISNACGQNGRDYGDEKCPAWQAFMTCRIDDKSEIEATIPATGVAPFLLNAQPPPFQCRPGTDPAGYWDETTQTLVDDTAFVNSNGRSDVEGCCFWGRGALHTRGSCNYGKINFHIGAQAASENRPSIYPNIDFCANPEAVCTEDRKEMRYVVGMFEWIDLVQDYYDSNVGWSYEEELYKFVDNGMNNDVFIDSVSNIIARGCHVHPCSSTSSIETNRFLYGLERRMNFKNIIKLVFELPIAAHDAQTSSNNGGNVPPPAESQATKRPTFRPTLKPTPYPQVEEVQYQTMAPTARLDTYPPTSPRRPTRSPVEQSDVTIFNDGRSHSINNYESSFIDESIVVSNNTTLIMEEGGYIEAPLNTDWPAVRLSISSTMVGRGGFVNGSYADTSFSEGDNDNGGEAIHVNNGQYSPETASSAEFYEGIHVIGGDAPCGVGGNALHVNGFGTHAIINGGNFLGGTGTIDDGLSLYVLNSAEVHIRAGTFRGEMKVERRGTIVFYGCFRKENTHITGVFEDGSELDVIVRSYYGGKVVLVPVYGQICETAPSASPTVFPTVSSQPTIPRPNHGAKTRVSYCSKIMAVFLLALWCT